MYADKTTRNEAAERPEDWVPTAEHPEAGDLILGTALMEHGYSTKRAIAFVDAVHAAERRATVERIRAAVDGRTWPVDPFDGLLVSDRIIAILDEEAAR